MDMVTSPWPPARPDHVRSRTHPMGTTAASSRRSAVSRCRPCFRRARRTAWLDWAAASPQAGTPNQSSCRRGSA